MNPRDVAISYGTAESTKSGTDPDMPPLEDKKPMSRSTSDGFIYRNPTAETLEAQVHFRCQLRRTAKSAGCFFHRGYSRLSVG